MIFSQSDRKWRKIHDYKIGQNNVHTTTAQSQSISLLATYVRLLSAKKNIIAKYIHICNKVTLSQNIFTNAAKQHNHKIY